MTFDAIVFEDIRVWEAFDLKTSIYNLVHFASKFAVWERYAEVCEPPGKKKKRCKVTVYGFSEVGNKIVSLTWQYMQNKWKGDSLKIELDLKRFDENLMIENKYKQHVFQNV